MDKIKSILIDTFNLNTDCATPDEIRERIVSGGQLRGTNMCIMILAMFIASIGLNMNSPAVIIGAMLISPLMEELPLFYPQIQDADCAAQGTLDADKNVVMENYLLILHVDRWLEEADMEKLEEWAGKIIGGPVIASQRPVPGAVMNAPGMEEGVDPEYPEGENGGEGMQEGTWPGTAEGGYPGTEEGRQPGTSEGTRGDNGTGTSGGITASEQSNQR